MTDVLQEKSFKFALRISKLSQYLSEKKHEFVLSRKILDSGTNIGLLIEEGKQGDSRSDFTSKYSVANKEAFKTNFLLRLLRDGEYISEDHARSMLDDCEQLQKMFVATLKTVRRAE